MRIMIFLIDRLVLIGGYLAGAAVLAMTALVTVDVAARFFLGGGTRMAVEFSGYLLVAIVFLGLAYTHRENAHIRVDLFVEMLPVRIRLWVELFGSIVFFAHAALLGYRGWQSVVTSYAFNTTSRTGIDVILWPIQALIPASFFLLALLLLVEFGRIWRRILNNRLTNSEDNQ